MGRQADRWGEDGLPAPWLLFSQRPGGRVGGGGCVGGVKGEVKRSEALLKGGSG